MKKSEVVVLTIFVVSLLAINIHSYFRKESLKAAYSALIERSMIQLSINDVGESELESLPGIGPVLARRIIDYRDRIGRYKSLEELKQVKGIGDKLYLKISPYLKL
ncbi:MAG: helix-hairpin-helix domain-containing protein [candidate division WOR-3 bacterium]|nr:MAG: helix-hairpin-helix domain-containing protein [candidate division WOR-3 bacterium]